MAVAVLTGGTWWQWCDCEEGGAGGECGERLNAEEAKETVDCGDMGSLWRVRGEIGFCMGENVEVVLICRRFLGCFRFLFWLFDWFSNRDIF